MVKDLSRQRFGHVVVQSASEERSFGQIKWNCLCDCGGTGKIPGSVLKGNRPPTCGCPLKDLHQELTQEYLKEILDYDPTVGIFRWKRLAWGCVPGESAGHNVGRGYLRIIIHGRNYFCHRLAWFYVYGVWPTREIDHIDRNASNNVIRNLRECESSSNSINKPKFSTNTSGYKGVAWSKAAKRWVAQIGVRGKHIYLGLFDTAIEAARAYDNAAATHYGAFAYLNFKDTL